MPTNTNIYGTDIKIHKKVSKGETFSLSGSQVRSLRTFPRAAHNIRLNFWVQGYCCCTFQPEKKGKFFKFGLKGARLVPKLERNPKWAGGHLCAQRKLRAPQSVHPKAAKPTLENEPHSHGFYRGQDHPKRVQHTRLATRLMRDSVLNLTRLYSNDNKK